MNVDNSKFMYVYPTIEIAIDLDELLKKVRDEIQCGLDFKEFNKQDVDNWSSEELVNHCEEVIYAFVADDLMGFEITDIYTSPIKEELVKMINADINKFKQSFNFKN